MNSTISKPSKSNSLYTRLVSGFLFPFHERLKHHTTVLVRRELEKTQWWDIAELHKLQTRQLRTLLVDISQHVPYYRKLFHDLDFDPEALSSLDGLQSLPFLTKEIIRNQLEDFKARNAFNLARFNTGGSSGEPLIFFIGKERVSHDVGAKWRATRWWGVDIGDPEIVVWGSPIELSAQDKVRAWRDRFLRTELLPAFEMSQEKLDSFIAAIRKRRPKMLFGYPSALSHIAQYALQRNQTMSDLGIKVAFVTSEALYDHQRETIEKAFGCPVANGYGGRDAGFIAHQCPHGSMHITAEDIIVEIVDPDGKVLPPNQAGEIVITHLSTWDFPFIRYRTGDIGVLDSEPCSCGRGLPLLKEIQGRSTDFIIAADGTVLHGLALIYILRDLSVVKAFKIVQENLQLTRVQVVADDGFNDEIRQLIQQGFQQRLGDQVQIDVETVNEIQPEHSGKFRYVMSKVA